MSVAEFLEQLAKRFEAAPCCDATLAKHCRDYATIALAHSAQYEAARLARERAAKR